MSRRVAIAVASLALAGPRLAHAQSAAPKAPPAAAFPEASAPAPAASDGASPPPAAGAPATPEAAAPSAPATVTPAARAAAVAPPPPPPPGYYPYPYPYYPYYYSPPPETPAEPKKQASRIYLQLGVGPGLFRAHNSSISDERHFTGGSVSGHFVVGGRAGRIVALGAAYVHDQIFSLSAKDELIDGDEPNLEHTNIGIDSLGFFTDLSVPSARGLHFPLYMGFSVLSQHTGDDSRSSEATLLMLGGGVGYEFDVGSHFYLGGLLRASVGDYKMREINGTEITCFVPALMLTATYDPSR